jgi:hypothetical protein
MWIIAGVTGGAVVWIELRKTQVDTIGLMTIVTRELFVCALQWKVSVVVIKLNGGPGVFGMASATLGSIDS